MFVREGKANLVVPASCCEVGGSYVDNDSLTI